MNDPKIKQQIADKIKDVSNILVTVSNNPSVDELSAALGLTLLLNKMDKHATAVFSGHIPPAITFLDPEKTFEDTTD
jgi:nanoRNase/pAp phosphatase (c-di-AMP/oligoRNAs hydrolase)